MHIVPLSPQGHVGQRLASLLADNWIVALVADRDLSARGIEVEMFGRPRRIPAGPALLSIKTGAPLVAASILATDEGWLCTLRPIELELSGSLREDVTRLTRRLAAEFERAISTRPPDWHLFQPGWDS
jgi:KDO2-lipid IV(A) lauroyltransferase